MNQEVHLKLNENINLSNLKRGESEIKIVSQIMHKYSNYEKECWRLYKHPKEKVFNELTALLTEISYLDKELTWACIEKLKRYKKEYSVRKYKSQFIKN